MSSNKWQAANGAQVPASITDTIKITAYPRTDIWRRNTTDEGDVFNAPYIYTTVQTGSFKRLAVSISVPYKTQFDQGGFMVSWPHSSRWIKGGIELFEGKPALGVVGTDRYSDWSLAPMPTGSDDGKVAWALFEVVRDETTMWVYCTVKGQRQALREIKWAFLDETEGETFQVGIYAAKPTPDEGDGEAGVEVTFDHFELDTGHK
ncbi:hypothetical protein LTR62_004175 [Meristemomyces frigidus]|uniref:Uncharacterized protein n=1 Tax=Meristemomyces frigidus TaxID=1508187 RepID=A0AAN7YKN3_9PEZI|nr:hypothetical protein LTR62_004175 [Meristemomyces frigidus]